MTINEKKMYLTRAIQLSLKSGCVRGKRGVVIVKDGKVVVEAFNLVLPIGDACEKGGCLRDKLGLGLGKDPHMCRSIHAEAKAIAQAALQGFSLKGSIAYMTCAPCMNCAKLLYVSGIKEVYYVDAHADLTGVNFLTKMRIICAREEVINDNPGLRMRDTVGQ